MKKNLKCAMILMCVLLLTACGKQFSPDTEQNNENDSKAENLTPTDDSLIVVGVSQIGSESVWRTANSNSIQNSFTKDSGFFLIFKNARQKQENQIKAIRSFISQQVDYIVFSPITENGWDTVLQEAKDAGIPVILMDRQLQTTDDSLYTTWVGSNFETEGRNAGLWLDGYLAEQGRNEEEIHIVVLQGTQGATSVIGRTEGFNAIAKEHPNWKILEQTDAEYTTAKGREVMEKMLRSYDKIDVVVSQNDDMTFGALDALKDAGLTTGVDGDVIILSFDAVKSALAMVQEGIINVDIECNPEQGEKIRDVIIALENGWSIEKAYYVDEKIFTPENVSDYIDSRNY